MGIRRVRAEFEAKFLPVDGEAGSGKIERKAYGDGQHALRASFRAADRPPGSTELELFINGHSVGVLERSGKKSELSLDSRNGDIVPEVASGDIAELWAGVDVVARGQFVED